MCGKGDAMKTWKSKLFGDNTMNFYGGLFAGIFVCTGSLFFVIAGLETKDTNLMLLALYLVLIGMFGLQLQNYHSRLADKIESKGGSEQQERQA